MNPSISQKCIAEFFGTFVLVLMGCGAAVIAKDHVGFLGIAFAFGLSVVGMAYALGHISGCHLNPAITIGFWAAGRMGGKDAALYMIAQILGAIVASGVLYLIASGKAEYSLAANGLGQDGVGPNSPDNYNVTSGLIAEIIFSAIFLLVVMGSTSKMTTTPIAGLGIGLTLTLIHIVGIPITGVSVNPARSIGPALFVGGKALGDLWVFIIGPIFGGLIGTGIYRLMDNSK
jgi:aquaporin Z